LVNLEDVTVGDSDERLKLARSLKRRGILLTLVVAAIGVIMVFALGDESILVLGTVLPDEIVGAAVAGVGVAAGSGMYQKGQKLEEPPRRPPPSVSELAALADLLDRGVITTSEFETAKRRFLASGG
jgi:hypothetical protein